MRSKLLSATISLSVAAIIAGCAAPLPPPAPIPEKIVIPFNESEYAALPKTGTAGLRGQAFLKTVGGDVKVGAGERVVIYPATSYSIEFWRLADSGLTPELDPRLGAAMKYVIADGQGNFSFGNMPPGDYFLMTTINWMSATGYNGRLEKQGGTITKRVTLSNGTVTEVMLTK